MKGAFFLWFGVVLFFGCAETPRGDFARAQAYFAEGRYREAIPLLERDLLRHPEHYESQAFIAYAYEKLGEADKAIEAYRKTLSLNPVNSMAFLGIARILAAQERWSEAWEHLSKARGKEANDVLLSLYPRFRSAFETGSFTPVSSQEVPAEKEGASVTVQVSIVPGSVKVRERITVAASSSWSCDPLDALFVQAIATTAEDGIARCYARFFARGLPVALDARYTLELTADGSVVAPKREDTEPSDLRSCVEKELRSLRFMAPPPASRSDTK